MPAENRQMFFGKKQDREEQVAFSGEEQVAFSGEDQVAFSHETPSFVHRVLQNSGRVVWIEIQFLSQKWNHARNLPCQSGQEQHCLSQNIEYDWNAV
jgi:hypothetical protein